MEQSNLPEAMRLQDKVVIITGAGGGIGRAMAVLFAAHGAAVVAVDVVAESVNDTLAAINSSDNCMAAGCDISDGEKVRQLFARVGQRYGRLDVLVNVAGIAGQGKALSQVDDASWQRMMDINLNGTFYCTQAAILLMRELEVKGSIVTVSSTGRLER